MIRLILDLVLLWKSIPVLLNYFDIQRVWVDVDANDVPVAQSGGAVNGSHRVFVSDEEAAIAGAASAYALYNLLNG